MLGHDKTITETERKQLMFQTAEEANAALRAVTTEVEFRAFQKRLLATDYYKHVELVGKRRGYEAQAFTAVPWKPTDAHYLYNDGKSVGRSAWKNLWRALEVRMWEEGQ